MRCEVEEGGFDYLALLTVGNCVSGTAKSQRLTKFYLDETDGIVITHDQIDFTESAAVIGL